MKIAVMSRSNLTQLSHARHSIFAVKLSSHSPPQTAYARCFTHALCFVPAQVEQVETSLTSIPAVSVDAGCVVEGETSVEVFEGDVVTCRAHVSLTRPSHRTSGAIALRTCNAQRVRCAGFDRIAVLLMALEFPVGPCPDAILVTLLTALT